jgi:phenylalanyl-tRNA synthetase beta chain
VTRDLSLFCDASQTAGELSEVVRGAAGPALQSVVVADKYTGKGVPDGKVSLMLALRYQDDARTLTSDEVQQSVDQVVKALVASGASLRGE